MNVSIADRDILRNLARRVAELAALPIQKERIELIRSLNDLQPKRPVVLAFPEGGWADLIPAAALQCQDPLMREWEECLRQRIFTHEQIGDDQPVMGHFIMEAIVNHSDYGVPIDWHRSGDRGAGKWDAPIKTPDDLRKLHHRTITVDRAETQRRMDLAHSIFGDVLQVRNRNWLFWTVGMTGTLIFLRGLDQMMYDLYDNPGLIHELMAFLRDETNAELDYYEREGLLPLNNEPDSYVGSGGLGATSHLPAKDFAGKVRCKDCWCLGESQEFVGVGPELFEEFALQYQLPLMKRFGLVCYGCCEPLDKKFDLILKNIPNLRRVSVSAWCDRRIAADKLQDKYVYSWKPAPSMICTPTVDWEHVEKTTRETLEIAKGCCVEMIMKDTHTFAGDPTRPGRWAKMAKRLAEG